MPILRWLHDEEARKTSSRVPTACLKRMMHFSMVTPNAENMLIQGDKLVALLPDYAEQCATPEKLDDS